MKGYAVIEDSTNMVKSLFSWGKDTELPSDYPVDSGCSLLELDKELFFHVQGRFVQVVGMKTKDKTATTYDELFEEMPEVATRQNEINELLTYLSTTDFYFIRQMDSGKAIPQDVQDRRNEIRARLLELGL